MQVEVKAAFFQSFGGINFMDADYHALGFAFVIARHLGARSRTLFTAIAISSNLNCEAEGIEIAKFRADACYYEKATVELMEDKEVHYYFWAEMNTRLRIALEDEREWAPAISGNAKWKYAVQKKSCLAVIATGVLSLTAIK